MRCDVPLQRETYVQTDTQLKFQRFHTLELLFKITKAKNYSLKYLAGSLEMTSLEAQSLDVGPMRPGWFIFTMISHCLIQTSQFSKQFCFHPAGFN